MSGKEAETPRIKRKPGPKTYRGQGELWDLKDRYQAWMAATGHAEATQKGAHSSLSWFLKFADQMGVKRAADVTPEVLETYAVALRQPDNGLPPAPRHVNHRIITLQLFFRWLAKEGVILYDAASDLERPRLPQEIPHTILTEDEVFRLLEAPDITTPVGYRDRALLELTYATGMRSLELRRIKTEHIDYKHGMVLVFQGKGRKDRNVPAPAAALAYIREYAEKIRPDFARARPKDDGTLFINYTRAKLTQDRLCGIFKSASQRAGLEKRVTPMTVRHTVATHLLEAGMDSRYIQAFLGHEKLSTTQIYAKVTLTGLKKHFAACHPMERGRRTK